MTPTIVPQPCGKPQYNKWGEHCWTCGERTLRCRGCETSADRLMDIAYNTSQFGGWEYVFVWNLTLASLLEAAAAQAIAQIVNLERDMRDSVFTALSSIDKIPWNDEPITLLKREIDRFVAENPECVAARNHEFDEIVAKPGGWAALESALLGLGKDAPS